MSDYAGANALAPFDRNIQRLYEIARVAAERLFGNQTFYFLPPEARKSLVGQEILNLLYIQADPDEGVDPARFRELLNSLVEANNAYWAE